MNEPGSEGKSWLTSRSGLALLAFVAIAAFFVVTEHTAHLLGALPYVLLLACPLVHFFHGGHGRRHVGHGGNRHDTTGGST